MDCLISKINKYLMKIIENYLPLPCIDELKNKTEIFDPENTYPQYKYYKSNKFYMFPVLRKYNDKWIWDSIISLDCRERYLIDKNNQQ